MGGRCLSCHMTWARVGAVVLVNEQAGCCFSLCTARSVAAIREEPRTTVDCWFSVSAVAMRAKKAGRTGIVSSAIKVARKGVGLE